MLGSVRNALVATFALAAVACAAPESEEVVDDSDLVAALSSGEAPISDACFLPSSSFEVGAWVAYTVGGSNRTPTEMLFVNHSTTATSIVVSVDVARDKVQVLSAPPDGSGAPLVEALIQDLSAYAEPDTSSEPAGSVGLQSRRLTTEAAKRLLTSAAKKLQQSSDALVRAIHDYTGFAYQRINRFLREGAAPTSWSDEAMTQEVRTLTQALERLPPVSAETRRWVKVGITDEGTVDTKELGAFLKTVRPGGVYQDPGFMSTTFRTTPPGVAYNSTVRFEIKGASGRDISMLSMYPNEEEVLFAPGTRFKVVSVKGEFTDSEMFARRSLWTEFVAATSEYFPDMNTARVTAQLDQGKVPILVVVLEEIVK